MSRSPLLLLALLATILATASEAQDDGYETGEKPRRELEHTSRFSLLTGWRYAPNGRFFDGYYQDPDNVGLERSGSGIGGPLLSGAFAYSPTNFFELGIDLFATYERFKLTGQPGLNAVTYGALIGLRFQHKFEVGPHGLIPSAGVLIGPMLAASYFDGGQAVENYTQSIGLTAGATVNLSEVWGLRFEYRLLTGRGEAEDIGPYEAAGSWFSVGLNYQFESAPDRPMGRMF